MGWIETCRYMLLVGMCRHPARGGAVPGLTPPAFGLAISRLCQAPNAYTDIGLSKKPNIDRVVPSYRVSGPFGQGSVRSPGVV